MQPLKTMGIVVRSVTVGDYNKMLTVICPELGKISVWAKGAKSPRHPAHACVSPLCYGEFVLSHKGDIYTLSSAALSESFFGLSADVERLAHGMYFASLAESISHEGVGEADTLKLLLNTLHFLEKEKNAPESLRLMLELRILSIAGFMPEVGSCSACGGSEVSFFDAVSGGARCSSCKTAASRAVSKSVLMLMDYYISAPLSRALSFKGDAADTRKALALSEEFIALHIGKIPALSYLKEISYK